MSSKTRYDRPRALLLSEFNVEAALDGSKFTSFESARFVGSEGWLVARYQNSGCLALANVFQGKSATQVVRARGKIVAWSTDRGLVVTVHDDDVLQVCDTTKSVPPVATHSQADFVGKGGLKKVQCVLLDNQRIYGVCADKIFIWNRKKIADRPRVVLLKDATADSSVRVIINVKQDFSSVVGPYLLILGNNDTFQEWRIDPVEDKMFAVFDGRHPERKLKYFNVWSHYPTICTSYRDEMVLWDASLPVLGAKEDEKTRPIMPDGTFAPDNPLNFKEKGMPTACHQDDTFLLLGDNSGLITARQRRGGALLYELNRAEQLAVEKGALVDFNLTNRVNVLRKVGRWVIVGTESGSIEILDMQQEKADPVFDFRLPSGGAVTAVNVVGPNLVALVAPPSADGPSGGSGKDKIKRSKSKFKMSGSGASLTGLSAPTVVIWSPRLPGLEFYQKLVDNPETTELTALLFCSFTNIMRYLTQIERAGEDITEFSATVERVREVIQDLVTNPRLVSFLRLRTLQSALDEYEQLLEKLSGSGRLLRFFTSSRLRRDLEFHNSALHRGLNEVEEHIKIRSFEMMQMIQAAEALETGINADDHPVEVGAPARAAPSPPRGSASPASLASASEYSSPPANGTPKSRSEYGEYGEYHATAVREKKSMISDVEGGAFWSENFQNDMMVEWGRFVESMQRRFGVDRFGIAEISQLQSMLDHSNTSYITQYKFSEFLKGFGPFSMCIDNVQDTLSQPWFHGFLSSRESELLMLIDGEPPGTFLIRFSKSKPGSFALAFLKDRGANHILIESCKPEGFRISDQASRGNTRLFQSLHEIVAHYQYVLRTPFISQLPSRPWFHGDLSTDEAIELLSQEKTGTYLIRFSSKGCFAASFVEELVPGRPQVKHVLVQNQGKTRYEINTGTGEVLVFATLTELVRYYCDKGIFKEPLTTVNKV